MKSINVFVLKGLLLIIGLFNFSESHLKSNILEIVDKLNLKHYLGEYDIEDFEITYPIRISEQGAVISQAFNSAQFYGNKVFFNLFAHGQTRNFSLIRNSDLIDENIEFIERNENSFKPLNIKLFDLCLFRGTIDSMQESKAALSLCDGMNGVFIIDKIVYGIERIPDYDLHKVKFDIKEIVPHIVYKIKIKNHKQCQEGHIKDYVNHSVSFYNGLYSASNTKKLSFATAVYVDYSLYTFLLKKHFYKNIDDNILKHVYTTMNIMQMIFDSSPVLNPVHFVLLKVEVLKKEHPINFLKKMNGFQYLSSFCHWQANFRAKEDKNIQSWDHAFLFTGFDLEDENGNPSIIGVAPVDGTCTPEHRCTLFEAHHFLGSYFVNEFCGHISLNSTSSLKERHKSKYENEGQLPGQRFDATQQCTLILGVGAKLDLDVPIESICQTIVCKKGKSTSKNHPALEGTYCGNKSWCRSGQCVAWGDDAPESIDGGWTNWSEYSQCKSNCISNGVNFQYSTRSCTNPRPKNEGNDCEGEKELVKLCSESQQCKDYLTVQSIGDNICANPPVNQKDIEKLTGKSRQVLNDESGGCVVWCQKANLKKWASWNQNYPDGTSCGKSGEKKYCLEGKCKDFSEPLIS